MYRCMCVCLCMINAGKLAEKFIIISATKIIKIAIVVQLVGWLLRWLTRWLLRWLDCLLVLWHVAGGMWQAAFPVSDYAFGNISSSYENRNSKSYACATYLSMYIRMYVC